MLHSCCAPCSTYTLEYLTQFADIGVYFANPNIHPKNEYLRRAKVQEQFIADFNERTGNHVQYIEAPYEPQTFMKMAKSRGLMDEPEGGLRCSACFEMRLDLVADAAQRFGYNYFGSALTLSPKKNAQLINELGMKVQEAYDVYYLPSDFKKNKGYERSLECVEIITFIDNVIVVVSLLQCVKALILKKLIKRLKLFRTVSILE